MSFTVSALLVAWFAILLLGLALAGLNRQVAMLVAHREAAEGGMLQPLPGRRMAELPFSGHSLTGLQMVLFADQGCKSCTEALPPFLSLAKQVSRGISAGILFLGEPPDRAWPSEVQVQQAEPRHLGNAAIPALPFGVVLGRDGLILAEQPLGSAQLLNEFGRRVSDMVKEAVPL